MSTYNKNKIPIDLISSFKNGSCGLFIGAGLSRAAGLPSWQALLEDLIKLAFDQNAINKKKVTELNKLARIPSKYLTLAEELNGILKSDLHKYIREKFDDQNIAPTELHKKLMDLPYRFILTTNYDSIIENAYIIKHQHMPSSFTYEQAASVNYKLWNKEKFIFKAHGDAKLAPDRIILTLQDYRRILYKERGYQSVLNNIFSTYNILFLGASLNDPELILLLDYIHMIYQGGGPKHFALMDKKVISDTEKNRWRLDYNINIIEYDSLNNHKEVEYFIDALIEEVSNS